MNQYSHAANSIQHRGPDRTRTIVLDNAVRIDFHRLCINGLDSASDQPFHVGDWHVCANAEIYNHRHLEERYPTRSKSDCEVIAHMLDQGCTVRETAKELDGVFSLFGANTVQKRAVIARDVFGVRALYWGSGPDLLFCVASEMKALRLAGCDEIRVFPPNTWMEVRYGEDDPGIVGMGHYWPTLTVQRYPPLICDEERAIRTCQTLLRRAVKKRIMSDRPIGCFLSGGLDSSLIAALLVEQMPSPKDLCTFSIGMPGSPDLKHAQDVATFLGTTHHQVVVSEEEMLAAIPETLRHIESFDVTTVRASTPMFLLSKWIAEHSSVRVIFSGEGADELSGSYLYLRHAPSKEAYQEECLRLTADLHRFDNLRADKSTAAHGLEIRTPFLDREFANMYLRIDPGLRQPRAVGEKQIEKYLLRKSFPTVIPDSVLWRTKEAFSDGVSSSTKSWFQVIQEHVAAHQTLVPVRSPRLPPAFPEAHWYRNLYEKFYGHQYDHLIPYYWLPRWQGDVQDPSARVLSTYDA